MRKTQRGVLSHFSWASAAVVGGGCGRRRLDFFRGFFLGLACYAQASTQALQFRAFSALA